MADMGDRISHAVAEDSPMTVRQIFYRLVSTGAIDKTELQYRAVVRIVTEMRREGRIPFSAVADSTRWTHKPASFVGVGQALRELADTYRRDPWQDQPAYVEVWLEKDALAGVLYSVTSEFDVPLMVTRGFPSITFLHGAAAAIAAEARPARLLYFGDWDPSGVDITRSVEDGIREFAPGADVSLTRVAITEGQIEQFDLPTRPTKVSDPRAHKWDGGSVELDTLPPRQLRTIVEKAIRVHVDRKAWAFAERAYAAQRDRLNVLVGEMMEPE